VTTQRGKQCGESYRGRASLIVIALVLTAMGTIGFSARAYAYSNESSRAIECAQSREGAIDELRATFEPEEGATVPVGSAVTFSVHSWFPVSFAIALSPTLLSSSDVDNGMGIAGPTGTYTFTSDQATAMPGTVYWDASISNANFTECAEFPPFSYTTTPRELTVTLPTPTPSPEPPPTAPPAPVRVPVTVSIVKPSGFTITHPTVAYDIHCTVGCSGDTSYQLILSRHYRRTDRTMQLDFESRQVSLAATSGGDEQFVYQYVGRALQTLRRLAREGDIIEIRIGVEVAGTAGETAQAQSTVRTRVRMGSRRRRRNKRKANMHTSRLRQRIRRGRSHLGSAIVDQPLSSEGSDGSGIGGSFLCSMMPLCKAAQKGHARRAASLS
jgi:hypothetical protein